MLRSVFQYEPRGDDTMKTMLFAALTVSMMVGAPVVAMAKDAETAKKDAKKEEPKKGAPAKDTAKEGGSTSDAYKLRGNTGS